MVETLVVSLLGLILGRNLANMGNLFPTVTYLAEMRNCQGRAGAQRTLVNKI